MAPLDLLEREQLGVITTREGSHARLALPDLVGEVLDLDLLEVGDRDRARALFADVQHLREEDGSYWTGYVFPEGVHWPGDRSTYTAASAILAADALSDTTAGADIVRGRTLVPPFEPLGLECGCDSADRQVDGLAGSARRTA